jgi:hypothetical protein
MRKLSTTKLRAYASSICVLIENCHGTRMESDDLVDSRPVHTIRVDAFYLGRTIL